EAGTYSADSAITPVTLAASVGDVRVISRTTSSVSFQWSIPVSDATYTIDRSPDGKSNWTSLATNWSTNSYTDTLPEGQPAVYRISGFKGTRSTGFSILQISTQMLPPQDVQVTSISGSEMDFSWKTMTARPAQTLIEVGQSSAATGWRTVA